MSHSKIRPRGIAALGYAMVLSACASKPPATAPIPTSSERRAPRSSPEAIARARADSARLPYTAADIHFITGMIPHHAQAIMMAKWAPTHGASPEIIRLTGRIVNAQEDEIFLMQQWLADRQQPIPEADPRGRKMNMGGQEHVHLMPGMLTEAQMKQLDQARGPQFDKLFLEFMIQHHKGAVDMVTELFASPGAGQDLFVFKFASDVSVDQSTEIARMEKMLEAFNP